MKKQRNEIPLKVVNLSKSYDEVKALKGLNFSLEQGSCVGLLGPNGAGKTTTCHLVSGLLKPDSGEILIHGMSFKNSRQEILENIGIQLQESRFYEKYTVKETFELFASFYRHHRNIAETLGELGLSEKKDKRLSALSGGEKQRVYLGCALIHDPQLLILDEPMTSLDPSSQKQTREFIASLKDQGKTILLCTHNMSEAKRLCDSILILDQGELICQGSCDELIEKISGRNILSFSLKKPEEYPKLKKLLEWLPEEFSPTQELGLNDGVEKAEELSRAMKNLSLEVSKLSLREASLEDVFFKATGRSFHANTKFR